MVEKREKLILCMHVYNKVKIMTIIKKIRGFLSINLWMCFSEGGREGGGWGVVAAGSATPLKSFWILHLSVNSQKTWKKGQLFFSFFFLFFLFYLFCRFVDIFQYFLIWIHFRHINLSLPNSYFMYQLFMVRHNLQRLF